MKATLLPSPPISGTVEEVHFHAMGNCTWVRFSPDDAEDWVGVFGNGEGSRNLHGICEQRVATLPNPKLAYVVALQSDYLIDYSTRQLLRLIQGSWCEGVIALPQMSAFAVWDLTKLKAIDAAGTLVWSSRRVSWDGIRNVNLVEEEIRGEAWSPDDEWSAFVVNPKTGDVLGGSF